MKRLFVDLQCQKYNSFFGQLSSSLFYHFFKSERKYSRLAKREKAIIENYHEHLSNFENSVENFCNYFGVNLVFWCQIHKDDIVHQIGEISIESNHTINILVSNYRVPLKFDLSSDTNVLNTFKLGFIPDIERFPSEHMNKTIFYLLGKRLDKCPVELESKWCATKYGKNGVIKFCHEKHFGQLFGVGFSVITTEDSVRRHANVRNGLLRHYNSKFENFLLLKARTNFRGKYKIDFKNDKFNLKDNDILFECGNEWCSFAATEKNLLKRHMKKCEPGPKKKYIQRDMCAETGRQFLIKEGFLSEDFRLKSAAFYDIESFAVPDRKNVGKKTEVISTQKMVSISVTANFSSGSRTKVFSRNSYDKEDYVRVLREFTSHLKNLQCEHVKTLPDQIHTSIAAIEEILEQNKQAEAEHRALLSVDRKTKFRAGLSYLKSLLKLRVFGFNSERYDLCILLPGLVELWGSKNVDVIRRNAGYMMLETSELRLLDVKNYIAGGGLASFAEAWGAGCAKQIFPYQYFQNIDDAKNCVTWPKYSYFHNDLSYKNIENITDELKRGYEIVCHRVSLSEYSEQMDCPEILDQSVDKITFPDSLELRLDSYKRFVVSPVDYCQNWETFELFYASDEVRNMFDFLIAYNRNDTEILAAAFDNYCEKFWTTFGVNPLEYFSLSHMSESIMFSEFDFTVNRPYSLANGEINELIRKNQRGGLVLIFHKHAIANPDPYDMLLFDRCVWALKNDQIIRKIVCYDFNALYAAAMRMFLPCGYGFLYTKCKNGFSWSCMKKVAGFSLESLEWIQYLQTLPPFTNADGTIHRIRHALNGQEHETRFQRCFGVKYSDGHAIFSDGHVKIGDHQYFMFYDGCRYHNCDLCDTKCISQTRLDDRRKQLEDLGTVIEIKGCEWSRLKKEISYKNSISHFFNRKTLISESEILNAVQTGDFFGLIQVDISSPDHVVQKWSKINFPLIPRHQDIDECMIDPNLAKKMKDKGYKFPIKRTLTLCFNAKDLLITTTMAQFYLDQGCTLSNLKTAVEFDRATPLKDFVNKATKERIAATRDNNEQKQDLYKRIVNASYGRTGMRQDNRMKIKYEGHSRKLGSKLVKKRVPLIGEFETSLYEVSSEPSTITDKVPGKP